MGSTEGTEVKCPGAIDVCSEAGQGKRKEGRDYLSAGFPIHN